ncbi:hypothetical protein D9758_012418 [Tetrapyrgos nigripes]|uniref:Nephrocystin 3-like N-terminal domain-containing protein n=1 Tax=Tetrapyrgos nigripes TaxID=182062 RepID=A0A8H5D6L5_9AGAR|nr:hypothetical protein D9758_012418 [Tetrapyrgos nigripes]
MKKVKNTAKALFRSKPGTPRSTNPTQNVSTPVPGDAAVSSVQNIKKEEVALDVIDKGLVILNAVSGWFGPLEAVTGILSECIKTYMEVMDNKENFAKLMNDLAEEVQDLEKQRAENQSSEMKQIFEDLSKKLLTVLNETKQKQDLSVLQQVIQSGRIAQEVQQFFKDISQAYRNCKFKVLLIIARQNNEIYKSLIFDKLEPSLEAFHGAQIGGGKARDSCTPGTRKQIIKDIEDWAERTTDENMGIGFMLAQYSPAFAEELKEAIHKDPTSIVEPPGIQLEKLVVSCWHKVFKSHKLNLMTPVVVIDALDECRDISSVLEVLIPAIQKQELLGLKFLFTSRPEYCMQRHLKIKGPISEGSNVDRMFLHDVDESLVKADIIKYLNAQFKLSDLLISAEDIERLAKMSGKLFIFAATLVKFILDPDNTDLSEERLLEVLDLKQEPDKLQTQALDDLYTVVLENAFKNQTERGKKQSLKILHTVITVKEAIPHSVIADMLDVGITKVEGVISKLHSVLYVVDSDHSIYPLHASFSDYIMAKERTKEIFWCDEQMYHTMLSQACFRNMMEKLKFNIGEIPSSFVIDKDIPDGQNLKNIDQTLRYSCNYWPHHFWGSNLEQDIVKIWERFIEAKIIFWIEAMNLLQSIPQAYNSLQFLLESAILAERLPGKADFAQNYKLQEVLSTKQRDGMLANNISCKWVAISKDGKLIVSGQSDGTIIIWNVLRGKEVRKINGHIGDVNSVAISPDGSKIVSGSHDKTVRIWDTATGAQIRVSLQGHSNYVQSVAFSADGTKIVSGSADETVRIWDAATGAQIGEPLHGHSSWVLSVALSADGTKIVSGSADETVRIWDAATGAQIGQPLQGHSNYVQSVAFSVDGTKIVSGSDDQTVRIWNAATGAQIGEPLQGHNHWVQSVAFSADETKIVSGSSDNTVRIWDAATGAQIGEPLKGHSNFVWSVAFSPDGTKIVSGSVDKTVRIWDAVTGDEIREPLQGHSDYVQSVTFSTDGIKIVSGSDDTTVRIWDAATGTQIREPLQGHSDYVWSVALSADGTKIVSGSDDKTVRIWDAATGAQIGQPLQGHSNSVWSVAFSGDGTQIVSGSSDKTVRIWDAATGAQIGEPFQGHSSSVNSVVFSADGTKIVSGSDDQTIRIWDTATGAQIGKPLQGHSNFVLSVALSADGTQIVSGSADETIRIWDAAAGAQIREPLHGHSNWVRSVAFSADGTKIVSGSVDKTVRIWDAATGAQIREPLQGHTEYVWSVAFSADGGTIVSGSGDKTIRVQEVLTDDNCPVAQIDINKTWTLDDNGWVHFPHISDHGIVWIPPSFRPLLCRAQNPFIISKQGYTKIDFSDCVYGEEWTKCWPEN